MKITQIGKYKVVFPIKQGAYAQTFRVVDENKKKYFLKLINLAKLTDQQVHGLTGSVIEIELGTSLNHPNVMHTAEKGEIVIEGQKYVYLVCDFIAGETVYEKVNREKHCSVYDVKHIAISVLKGLKYLHSFENPIIHNEITPQNIMLDMSQNPATPIIIDFGHAQKLMANNSKFYVDELNPFFLAPEIFRGVYSTRTDLYAVGAMMYFLLFGMEPWHISLSGKSPEERIQAVLDARKSPLKVPDLNIFELDDNLLNIIAKALNQDVDKRFQSAQEFILALKGEIVVDNTGYQKVDVKTNEPKKQAPKIPVKKGNGFADVAGMDELKNRLQSEVIDLFRNPEKYQKLRVKVPNGILLYGPPGCGKTFIAEKFAEELGCNYMYAHCSDVASPYIHGGQEKIAALFEKARQDAPTVLFLDELDAMIADRSLHHNVSEQGEVNEFLTQLNNCAESHVIVVGATNNPKRIDSAALRSGRLDVKVYVPAPDFESRIALLKLSLKDIAAEDIDFDELARKTDGFVSKDVCVLVNKAALIAAQSDKEQVDMTSLLKALESTKGNLPSVPRAVLQQHENIRDEFEGRSPAQATRNPIGFRR